MAAAVVRRLCIRFPKPAIKSRWVYFNEWPDCGEDPTSMRIPVIALEVATGRRKVSPIHPEACSDELLRYL